MVPEPKEADALLALAKKLDEAQPRLAITLKS